MALPATLLSIVVLFSAVPAEAQSRHYDIHAEGVDAAEAGRMLDQLYEHLRTFFGQSSTDRVPVYIYPDRTGFEEAMAEENESADGLGGGYSVSSGKIYLYVQPSAYYTRHLMLHEAVHQVHASCTPSKKLPPAFWYREGVAEYFGMHNWDGRTLITGTVPAISLEDYPQQALDWIDRDHGDLQDLVAAKTECPRPAAWALVHYLLHTHARRFAVLREMLDRGQAPLPAWRKAFGAGPRTMTKAFRKWVVEHQQPWKDVWMPWQQRGDALEGGNRDRVALAVLKQTPRHIRVELQSLDGPLDAGLVLGYQSPDDLLTVRVHPDGQVWIGRGWRRLSEPFHVDRGPAGDQPVTMEWTAADGQVTVKVAGHEFPPIEAPGQVGLLARRCRVQFQVRIDRDPAESH